MDWPDGSAVVEDDDAEVHDLARGQAVQLGHTGQADHAGPVHLEEGGVLDHDVPDLLVLLPLAPPSHPVLQLKVKIQNWKFSRKIVVGK